MDNLNINILREYFDEDDEDRELNPPGDLTARRLTPEEVRARGPQGPCTWYRYNAGGRMIRITEPDGTILDPDDPFVALPRYMAAVSYARYRVGWVPNLEYVFWGEVLQLDEPDSAVFTRPEQSWGYRVFRLRKMKRLSGAVGGWFHRPEGAPKLLFVPLDEWVELYAAYHSPLTR